MTNRNLRRRVIREARKWIGTPYLHQASACQQGTDCLGLIRGVWRSVYGREPQRVRNYSSDWGEVGGEDPLADAARNWCTEITPGMEYVGDLVLFRWQGSRVSKHVGILSARGRFIHAYEKAGVVETRLGAHWRGNITAYFRFPDSEKLKA